MHTIRLTNSILGWMLLPVSEGSESILADLYAQDYGNLKPSERAFMKDEPIEKAILHIKEVCKDMNIGVSFCGKKGGPTIRLWPRHPLVVQPEKISVDLKWACWMNDQGVWDEYAPGVWDKMFAAWQGGAPVTISTGPRKEIRYGLVTITKGKASGYFATEWDDRESLADTLETECDEAFESMIPYSMHLDAPGMDWEFTVKGRSFRKLMQRIDAEENALLETDQREWGYIKNCFKTPAGDTDES